MDDNAKTYPHTADHRAKGDWNPIWDQLGDLDPEFLEALQYAAKGQGLLGGLAILFCAMVIDRIAQGMYRKKVAGD